MRAELRAGGVVAALALSIGLLAPGCASSTKSTIRIGVWGGCAGPFSIVNEPALAGAELPLIRRGGKLEGSKPSDGLEGASVAGKRVQLLLGCEDYLSGKSTLAAVRRLVEQEGANVIVTPPGEGDGLLIRDYAKRHPGIVFLATSWEPETTLEQPAPNLFRFTLDHVQAMAGLGAYAYHVLGWRNAVTFGDDNPFGWGAVSGFVAEFCSLGGNVAQRLWAPDPANWPRLVGEIPAQGVDGVLLAVGLQGTRGFFNAYGRLQPDLSRHVLTSGFALIFAGRGPSMDGRPPPGLSRRLLGVVTGYRLPFQSPAPAWQRYLHDFEKTFPGIEDGIDVSDYDAMEAVLEALERVHGDLSHGERRLMAALRGLELDSPVGRIRLDANRQAIGPNYLSRVERDTRGRLVIRAFRAVPNVEQTFNGYFSSRSPAAGRAQPLCRHGNAPPWAR